MKVGVGYHSDRQGETILKFPLLLFYHITGDMDELGVRVGADSLVDRQAECPPSPSV